MDSLDGYPALLNSAEAELDSIPLANTTQRGEAEKILNGLKETAVEAAKEAITLINEAVTATNHLIQTADKLIVNVTILPKFEGAMFVATASGEPKDIINGINELESKINDIDKVLNQLFGGIQTNLSESCALNQKLTTIENCLPGLPYADLTGATITGTVFTNANMRGVTLTAAIGLSAANLSQVDLSGATLGSNLAGVNLAGANVGAGPGLNGKCVRDGRNNVIDLSGVNLSGANLAGVCLLNAQLIGADLSNANLAGVDLTNANLYEADLEKAVFYVDDEFAILENATLAFAHLTGADLYKANLMGADLTHADFTDANLARATISLSTTLTNAIFKEVSFVCANLNGAQLVFVDISWADLRGADLTGADLSRSNLSGSNFTGAEYSTNTRWPDFFNPLLAGAVQAANPMCTDS